MILVSAAVLQWLFTQDGNATNSPLSYAGFTYTEPSGTKQCQGDRYRESGPALLLWNGETWAQVEGEDRGMSTSTTEKTPRLQHIRFEDVAMERINPLIDRQFACGERSMLARIILRKGAVVPEHSHENEQITYLLEGALKFIVLGQEILVRAGEVLVIPSYIPHSAEALEDTVDLDIFCPPRADWINGTDAYLRK